MGWCTLLAMLTSLMLTAGGGQKIIVLLNILLALLGNGAMYNQNTAYLTSQVQFNTIANVMLPSKSWMDAITMSHHLIRVRVRVKDIHADDCHYLGPCGKANPDPGQNEGGSFHYAARRYPYQREEGRRYYLSPDQQNGAYYCHCVEEETPPQGPYLVGPPEPYSKASQKQTYVPGQEFVRIYKPKRCHISLPPCWSS